MNDPAKRKAGYEDLLTLPNNVVGEILNGQLHTSPRPSPRHALAYSSLGFALGGPFHQGIGGPGGWWIIDEPELHLAAEILVPDLAGWRRERMPELPESAWFEMAPNWVCEIPSPSTAQIDRHVKMPIYARAGVGHLWLVDPEVRTLEAYAIGNDGLWTLLTTIANDDPVQLPPFDAVSFSLNGLWT